MSSWVGRARMCIGATFQIENGGLKPPRTRGAIRDCCRGGACLRAAAVVLALLLILPGALFAQTTAGSISGRITDPQGAVVPNCSVVAFNQDQNTTQRTTADAEGQFVFSVLLPGRYTITVEAEGFKAFKKRDVVLTANSTVALGALQLEVGGVLQTVEVVAQGQEVQVDTAQRGDSVIGQQIQDIQVNGQSPLFFLRLIPGVYSNANLVESSQSYPAAYVNGSRADSMHVTVNGGTNQDTGANNGWMATTNLDTVQEVTVLTSNYQAQYGRSSSAQISIVTKSGSSQFHGSGFEYFRDKGLNANSWTNNRTGLPTPDYHYNDFGFTFGGPVTIPGKFNTDRSKLFFFWSEEWHRQLVPMGERRVTVPTEAERNGDFSASIASDGRRVVVRDPVTRAPYADNRIPGSQLYKPGTALLKLFPLPNAVDAKHPEYNYTSQASASHPRREDLVRADYNINSNWRMYAHVLRSADNLKNPYGIWGMTNIPLYDIQYEVPGRHYVLNATVTISPTAVNEITVSHSRNSQYYGMRKGSDAMTRKATGVDLPTLFPPYQDLISGYSFGGTQISNSPSFNTGNNPFFNANRVTEIVDNYSKTWRSHLFKVGGYFMHNWKVQPSGANYAGTYNFGDSSSNPLDTGFGFANAAAGVFNSFQQASAYANGWPLYNQFEFYGQDTWKATKRLTLEYGARFYYLGPVHNGGDADVANFFLGAFDPARAARLLRPGFSNTGSRVAVDPLTGQTYAELFIGAYAPGSGDIQNGLRVLGKDGVSRNITRSPGLMPAPRIGFAYDLSGKGTFVLRGGGGMFYNRTHTDPYMNILGNPPVTVQNTVNYGFVQNLTSTTAIVRVPGINTFSDSSSTPTTYSYSLGIESRLPKEILLNVSYVGSVSNHQLQRVDLNEVPFGAAFLPENQDPTLQKRSPNARLGSNALLSQFLRPFTGFDAINTRMFSGNSNYNSLQASLNRRFASGLMLGAAYTWSKCLDTSDSEATIRNDPNNHMAFYGPCGFDLKHNFIANYVYALPAFASHVGDSRVARAALNDWQISGLTTFRTGTPFGAGMNVSGVSNINFTGTPNWGPVLLCVADPLSGTSSDPYNRLNAGAFALPPVGSLGLGCGRNSLRRPGMNNWDLSLQKTVRLGEKLRVLLRGQAFNAFNHTQFNGINSTLRFSGLTNPTITNLPYDSNGKLVLTNGFGTVSGVESPRIVQLVMKVEF